MPPARPARADGAAVNGADRTLRWFFEDVWGQFDDDHTRPGAPLFPSERKNTDGSARRVGDDALRKGLSDAAKAHLPGWRDKLSRTSCVAPEAAGSALVPGRGSCSASCPNPRIPMRGRLRRLHQDFAQRGVCKHDTRPGRPVLQFGPVKAG